MARGKERRDTVEKERLGETEFGELTSACRMLGKWNQKFLTGGKLIKAQTLVTKITTRYLNVSDKILDFCCRSRNLDQN